VWLSDWNLLRKQVLPLVTTLSNLGFDNEAGEKCWRRAAGNGFSEPEEESFTAALAGNLAYRKP